LLTVVIVDTCNKAGLTFTMAYRIKINECSYRDLTALPGVGRANAEAIMDMREHYGSLKQEHLSLLPRLRVTGALLEMLDFEEYSPPSQRMMPDLKGLRIGDPWEKPMSMPGYGYWQPQAPQTPDVDAIGHMPPRDYVTGGPSVRPKYAPELPPNTLAKRDKEQLDYKTTAQRSTNLPKGISFKGDPSSSWKAFFSKFTSFADDQKWSAAQRKRQLCWCLEGKASEFHTNLLEREPSIDFSDLVAKMESRFGMQELPETLQIKFQYTKQQPEETVREWADRAITMATKAFQHLPEEHVEKQAALKFCQGLQDREAGQYAINQRPMTVEKALDQVKWFQHTNRVMSYGRYQRKDVRQISQFPDYEEENVYPGVYAVGQSSRWHPDSNEGTGPRVRFTDTKSDLEKHVSSIGSRMDEVEKNMGGVRQTVEKIDMKLAKMEAVIAAMSFRRPRSPSPGRKQGCFQCGAEGHIKRDCPDLKLRVSQVEEEREADLNSDGSMQGANRRPQN